MPYGRLYQNVLVSKGQLKKEKEKQWTDTKLSWYSQTTLILYICSRTFHSSLAGVIGWGSADLGFISSFLIDLLILADGVIYQVSFLKE